MMKNNSLYIHIPFCKNICPYCDFPKTVSNYLTKEKYINSLKQEALLKGYNNLKLKTLYLGGGTPSSLEYDLLEDLLIFINNTFDFSCLEEFTIEININDLTIELLQLLSKYHVNRFSIGIQTISEKGQQLLNRVCSKDEIISRFEAFEILNIDNYSVDLMYGYPNETLDELEEDINFITNLNPKHISIYCLIKESHTIFGYKNIQELDDEVQRNMYYYIKNKLERLGFHHYETSNYSKDGFESKHNLVYFHDQEYYSLGSGSSSFLNNIHYSHTNNVIEYINGIKNNTILEEKEVLELDELMDEFVMMNLRLIDGLNLNEFYKRFNYKLTDIYQVNLDLFDLSETTLKVKNTNLFVANYCTLELIKTNKLSR